MEHEGEQSVFEEEKHFRRSFFSWKILNYLSNSTMMTNDRVVLKSDFVKHFIERKKTRVNLFVDNFFLFDHKFGRLFDSI